MKSALLFLLAASIAAPNLAAQAPCFEQAISTTSPPAWDVDVGDLDSDGSLDVATANWSSDTVSILFGAGDGTFAGPVDLPAAGEPRAVAIGDISGDGNLDVISANYVAGEIHTFLGSPSGTLFPTTPLSTSPWPYSIALGDLDIDGELDLASAHFSSGTVSVHLSSGSLTFLPYKTYSVGTDPRQIVVGDFDGSGSPDLATADAGSFGVSVLLGFGDGTFPPSQLHPIGASPSKLATGDVNGDSFFDLVTTDGASDTVSVLLADGSGSFIAPQALPVLGWPANVRVADIDGDTISDIAVASFNSCQISILIGDGSGTGYALASHDTACSPNSLEIGDFSGDGQLDIASASATAGSVSTILACSAGAASPSIVSVGATLSATPDNVTILGMNLDLVSDVLVAGIPASILFQSPTTLIVSPAPSPPGFMTVQALGPSGSASHIMKMWPTTQVTSTGPGGHVYVELDNGDVGLYALAFGTGVLPTPFPIMSPPTWYGVLLDITGPVFTIGTGAFATSDPVMLSYPVPDNASLAGLTIYLQAWCQQGFFGSGVTYSFTNMAAVTF